jgi:hypothetical protein
MGGACYLLNGRFNRTTIRFQGFLTLSRSSLIMRSDHRCTHVFYPLIVFLCLVLVLGSGCTSVVQPPPVIVTPSPPAVNDGDRSWMEVPLTDLQGKGNFSIRSFAGKTVMLQVVSDACPSCVSQLSREIGEIQRIPGVQDKSITVVALDIDQPGDRGFIAKYHDQVNFSGYTARSPEAMTLQLFNSMGPFAIATESIPVILICPDGHEVLLPPGFKTTDALQTFLAKEC